MSQSILVASGKGGVGKSVLTANLGAVMASSGASVIIVDADIGLRSQDAVLGLENGVVYDLIDVLHCECDLSQALLDCPSVPGLRLLPAAQFARVRSLEPEKFKKVLKQLKLLADYVLIDAPAGIEKGLRNLLNAGCDEAILVVTPDDICIRDAERAAQVFEAKHLPRPRLIVNRLDNDLIQKHEMISARVLADTIDLPLLGEVPEDPMVYRSVLRHVLLADYDCKARSALLRIAGRLKGEMIPFPEIGKQRIPLLRRLFPVNPKEVTPIDRH